MCSPHAYILNIMLLSYFPSIINILLRLKASYNVKKGFCLCIVVLERCLQSYCEVWNPLTSFDVTNICILGWWPCITNKKCVIAIVTSFSFLIRGTSPFFFLMFAVSHLLRSCIVSPSRLLRHTYLHKIRMNTTYLG